MDEKLKQEIEALGELIQEASQKHNAHISIFSTDGKCWSATGFANNELIDLCGGFKNGI